MVKAAFDMIRQSSQSNAAVSIHLLETFASVAAHTHGEDDRRVFLRHAKMVFDGCRQNQSDLEDRKDLFAHYRAVIDAMK